MKSLQHHKKQEPEGRKKLKVVILNDSARIGGAERFLIDLVKKLNSDVFEVSVVCPDNGPLVENLQKCGIHVIPMALSYFSRRTKSSYMNYVATLLKLYWLFKTLHIDVVHCNSCRAAHWGVPLSWLLSVRTICHVRDIGYTKFTRFMLKHAPRLVVPSEAVKRAVVSVGVEKSKILVVYDGEDTNFYRPITPNEVLTREFPDTHNTLKIGMVGRIVEWKRHIDLVEAVGLLRNKLDFQVIIVGELWNQSSELSKVLQDRIMALGLYGRIIFTGFRDNVRDIMASLDIVVVPSEEEPSGKVVIESMAMGKPVIGTRSGGIPEIIQDGVDGILVPVRDPVCIANAIEILANNREYAATIGQNARRRIVESFSVETHVRKMQELYLAQ